MKNSGYIRRIDDLGRIVIPKEIRKNMRLRVGETLEVSLNDDNYIVLKKFSVVSRISELAQELTESMNIFTKHNIIIMDSSEIIACSCSLKNQILNKPISDDMRDKIERREKMLQNHIKDLNIIDGKKLKCSYVDSAIIVSGEVVGLIMVLSESEIITDFEMKIVEIVSTFISRYLEE